MDISDAEAYFAGMNQAEQEGFLAQLGPEETKELDGLLLSSGALWDWNAFARSEQLPPDGDWMTWLVPGIWYRVL